MRVEVYVPPAEQRRKPDDLEEKLRKEELEKLQNLAKEIGMPALAEADARRYRLRNKNPLGLESVSTEDYKVWEQWLPTAYRTDVANDDFDFGLRRWSSYAYDHIPLQVRELIRDVRSEFYALEIRTPEKITDPALFGWIGKKAYLLARWGEVDERLLSFEQLKHGLKAREDVRKISEKFDFSTVKFRVFIGFVFLSILSSFGYLFFCKMFGLSAEQKYIDYMIILCVSVSVGAPIFLSIAESILKRSNKIKKEIMRIKDAHPWAFTS